MRNLTYKRKLRSIYYQDQTDFEDYVWKAFHGKNMDLDITKNTDFL